MTVKAVKRSILNLVDANFVDSDSTKPQRQQFAATEYGREGKVVASEDVKKGIKGIGINKCARESGFDRKNFIRKLIRGIPVKRNSYNEFVSWLQNYELENGEQSLQRV